LQTNADLLIKHLENLFRRAATEEIAVHLETRDGFLAALGRAELQRGAVRGVILPRTGLYEDDVFDLVDT
jgi:hypothetical protein